VLATCVFRVKGLIVFEMRQHAEVAQGKEDGEEDGEEEGDRRRKQKRTREREGERRRKKERERGREKKKGGRDLIQDLGFRI